MTQPVAGAQVQNLNCGLVQPLPAAAAVNVTIVPPDWGDVLSEVRVALAHIPRMYVNLSAALTALVPPEAVTVTSTVPDPAGVVAVISLALLTVKVLAAVEPNFTALTATKLVPMMVTDVPPPAGPEFGATDVTVGGARAPKVN